MSKSCCDEQMPPKWQVILTVIGLGLMFLWALNGCAPKLRCEDRDGIEVCSRKECRNPSTGQFIKCPEVR